MSHVVEWGFCKICLITRDLGDLRRQNKPLVCTCGEPLTSGVAEPNPADIYPYVVAPKPFDCGATAHVFRATHYRTGQLAVCKMYTAEAIDLIGLEKLTEQAQCVATIRSPGVMPLLDIIPTGKNVALFVPEIHGMLLERLRFEKGREAEQTLAIAMQLVDCLEGMHKRRVCHHDLKPSNVFMEDGRAMLIDLSSAFLMRREPPIHGFTPGFASPELVLGNWAQLEAPSDFYALGNTIIDKLIGYDAVAVVKPPCVTGQTEAPYLSALAGRRAMLMWTLRQKGVDKAVCDVLDRLVQEDPARRPQTAREVRARLAAAQARVVCLGTKKFAKLVGAP